MRNVDWMEPSERPLTLPKEVIIVSTLVINFEQGSVGFSERLKVPRDLWEAGKIAIRPNITIDPKDNKVDCEWLIESR